MTPQPIRFVAREPVTTFTTRPGHFSFRQDRRFPWLQKIAVAVLQKLGCEAQERLTTFDTITVDSRKVVDALVHQRGLLELAFNKQAKRLLIGPKNFNELMGETYATRFTSAVEFPVNFQVWQREFGTRVMDMLVTIVPWMEGVLVMPADDTTKVVDALAEANGKVYATEAKLAAESRRLTEALEESERWKESALTVMPDFQKIGEVLGLPVGESVHDKILPAILEMKRQLDGIRIALEDYE